VCSAKKSQNRYDPKHVSPNFHIYPNKYNVSFILVVIDSHVFEHILVCILLDLATTFLDWREYSLVHIYD
jgi:hypothetical protein